MICFKNYLMVILILFWNVSLGLVYNQVSVAPMELQEEKC